MDDNSTVRGIMKRSVITNEKKTISYNVGTCWSNLTSDLKRVKSLKKFKRRLKKETI